MNPDDKRQRLVALLGQIQVQQHGPAAALPVFQILQRLYFWREGGALLWLLRAGLGKAEREAQASDKDYGNENCFHAGP
jgi:hypothetical protein